MSEVLIKGRYRVEGDEFTVNLWKVHERVKAEGYVQVRLAA